jgi:hypothetical protein
MTEHDDSQDVIAQLQAADPWPAQRPVDQAIADRALALVEKELNVNTTGETPRRQRRSLLIALAALVAVAAIAGAAVRLSDGGSSGTESQGRPLGGGGGAIQSCIQFSLDILGQSPIAFDGTVSKIEGNRVTFDVERWFRGGEGDTVTTLASGLIEGDVALEGGVGFVEGGRYLVSGDDTSGEIVPAICGFSMEYTPTAAADWARAFAAS